VIRVEDIADPSDPELEVEFTLRHRSTFLPEALGSVSIADPTSKELRRPFLRKRSTTASKRANAQYYGGDPDRSGDPQTVCLVRSAG
jgi:hypothetical protein